MSKIVSSIVWTFGPIIAPASRARLIPLERFFLPSDEIILPVLIFVI
jgi:hypothetical protein